MNVKMNPEAKQKIVEALRSGKYEQGRGQLRDSNNCFCVWGVISDISGKDAWSEGVNFLDDYAYGGLICGPTNDVLNWVAPSSTAPKDVKVVIDGVADSIMQHNDDGATFAQLADAIEQQL